MSDFKESRRPAISSSVSGGLRLDLGAFEIGETAAFMTRHEIGNAVAAEVKRRCAEVATIAVAQAFAKADFQERIARAVEAAIKAELPKEPAPPNNEPQSQEEPT